MDSQDRADARAARGCRCCGTSLIGLLLIIAIIFWLDYSKAQRMAQEMDMSKLASTEQVEEFLEKQDIKVKKEDGDWKAEAPWKQPLVDRLRARFDSLARSERLADAQRRADESAQYLRRLLEETPGDLAPYLDQMKEKLAYVTDRDTVRRTVEQLASLDQGWLEKEARRLLDSAPGENLDLYIEKLAAIFDNIKDTDLRRELRETIDRQTQRQGRQQQLAELPKIDPDTGELPLVLQYMRDHSEKRKVQDWGFVREVELADGHFYSVELSFTDGSRSVYYIRAGQVQLMATTTSGK
jgi:hypothetical protein